MDLFQKEIIESRSKSISDGRLHKEHLADLRKSGLSDETICAAGLVTISADAATEYSGYPAGSDCLVFEYPSANGTAHYRLKPLRPLATSDGEGMKYLAPKGSRNRLYVPPTTDPDGLGNSNVPLIVTEGEKKALKACQEGYFAVGISGVWSWRTTNGDGSGETKALDEFDAMSWIGRNVYIVFDSDVGHNSEVQAAEKALARELSKRGARILCVRLPELSEMKTGLDDFLAREGKDAFEQLLKNATSPTETYFEGREFRPKRLAVELAARDRYIFGMDSTTGAGSLYVYRKGVFERAGDIAVTAQGLLGDRVRTNRIEEAVAALENEVAIPIERLNAERGLINCENGMLDPSTSELHPHDPKYLSTIQIPVKWDPAAKSNILDEFLDVMCDKGAEAICELTGYLLLPMNIIKKLFIYHGRSDTGKTTLMNLQRALIGPTHCSGVSLQSLSNPDRRFIMAEMENKLVNFFDDLPVKRIEDSTMPKVITGGSERIRVERKNKDAYQTANVCRMVFSCNELPPCRDKDEAWYSRLCILPFKKKLPEDKQDRGLRDKFATDLSIRQAMFVKAAEGFRRLQARGFTLEGSRDELDAYKQRNDPVMAFLDERCVVVNSDDAKEKRTELRQAYEEYCAEHGFFKLASARAFYDRIRGDSRFTEKKDKGERYFVGLSLKTGAEL